jgi:hypothetical protein
MLEEQRLAPLVPRNREPRQPVHTPGIKLGESTMAEREGGGGSPWVAFLAGIILIAVVAFGVIAYTGGLQQRETAELELNVPDINVNPPDIDLPEPPPAPVTPPTANEAPAEPPAEAPTN